MQAPAVLDGSSDKLCCIFSSLAGLGFLSSAVTVGFGSGAVWFFLPVRNRSLDEWRNTCLQLSMLQFTAWFRPGLGGFDLVSHMSHRVSVAAATAPGSKMGLEAALLL